MPDPTICPTENAAQNTAARQAVLLFLKAPEKGRVKTRLARTTGRDAALEIYKNFVRDTLAMLKRSGRPTILCFHPAHAEKTLKQWLSGDYLFWPQTGKDLGERMMNALMRAFSENYSRVLLMGTDIPDLPESVIQEAFDALEGHPAVMGPATDGGYYLIGFNRRRFSPRFFRDIAWSTPSAFSQTLNKMNTQGVSCHILPEWRDIDDMDDLKDLMSRVDALRIHAPLTLGCLASLGLLSADDASENEATRPKSAPEFD
jgi:rSAM/selenodomain-associated transferase 1